MHADALAVRGGLEAAGVPDAVAVLSVKSQDGLLELECEGGSPALAMGAVRASRS
jgi:hypothetical protein